MTKSTGKYKYSPHPSMKGNHYGRWFGKGNQFAKGHKHGNTSEQAKALHADPERHKRMIAGLEKSRAKGHKTQMRNAAKLRKARELYNLANPPIQTAQQPEKMLAYDLACKALEPYDVEPLKQQPVEYYEEIIKFFRPDFKGWKKALKK